MEKSYIRKVNYYETDGMQVVHHSNYIRYLEEARIYLMDEIGLPYQKVEAEGIFIPVININCNYKSPAKFDDVLDIRVKIKEYTGVKLIVGYEIKNHKTEELILTGETKHCFTTTEMKPISLKRLKKNMNEILEKAMV